MDTLFEIPASVAPRKKWRRKKKMAPALRSALEKAMGKVGFAIHELMTREKKSRTWKVEPEQQLSIEVADRLRALTIEYYETGGKRGLRAVWCHVPNEGNRSAVTNMLLRAMGMLSGSPDFWFVWEGGGGMIELKVGGDLGENQIHYQTWAAAFGARRATKRRVEDVIEELIAWGAIIGIPARGALEY